MKLNLGCGTSKIDGFVNVDIDSSLSPDQCWDFRRDFPLEKDSVDMIVMYHVIEHIEKKFHYDLLREVQRVLVSEGVFIVSFPEFLKCVENWKSNKNGQRDFWEATLYGRQLSDPDYHVCIMDSDLFKLHLVRHGFEILSTHSEPGQDFNTVIKCKKVPFLTYEGVIRQVVGF